MSPRSPLVLFLKYLSYLQIALASLLIVCLLLTMAALGMYAIVCVEQVPNQFHVFASFVLYSVLVVTCAYAIFQLVAPLRVLKTGNRLEHNWAFWFAFSWFLTIVTFTCLGVHDTVKRSERFERVIDASLTLLKVAGIFDWAGSIFALMFSIVFKTASVKYNLY
ncbi:hypothetical protein H4R34_000574 [Dimargaris verticillata]|uniref:Uncharacterized protein n=1 Tax=Dimargaris verticillata TaxID=2761393 RepID=A0A9W8B615_9FUNG|nr:hypothetical protein H4R34_000574 [Dimargaris verticillata]